MTSFSLYHDQTKITKKMEGVVQDNKYHYKTKTRHTTKKGTTGAEKKLCHITSLLKKGEKVIDLYHSTKSVMQTISQSTLKLIYNSFNN